MFSFNKKGTIKEFQKFIEEVYSSPDDRLYSIWDLLAQEQRFAMRSLKGIRKGNKEKLKYNLLISLSWLMAISNRLHIDTEEEVWKRFPGRCSYCGKNPCECKKVKPQSRLKIKIDKNLRPKTLKEFQEMFESIYPSKSRTLADAGVHFAEEIGEVGEAIHNYLGQHLNKQFADIKSEIGDLMSCIFGVANSAGLDISKELSHMYSENCHVCHKAPCICKFSEVAQIQS